MGISGTRAAMGVIMGGMLMITVIAKNWKALLAGIFISISVFVFFSYTNIGSGNQYIHKMRSSFHPSDALVDMWSCKTECKAYVYGQLVGILHNVVDISGDKKSGIHTEPCRDKSTQAFVAYFKHEYPGTPGKENTVYGKVEYQSHNSRFHPYASYQVRVENRQRMKELMAKKPLGYGIGLSKASNL